MLAARCTAGAPTSSGGTRVGFSSKWSGSFASVPSCGPPCSKNVWLVCSAKMRMTRLAASRGRPIGLGSSSHFRSWPTVRAAPDWAALRVKWLFQCLAEHEVGGVRPQFAQQQRVGDLANQGTECLFHLCPPVFFAGCLADHVVDLPQVGRFDLGLEPRVGREVVGQCLVENLLQCPPQAGGGRRLWGEAVLQRGELLVRLKLLGGV